MLYRPEAKIALLVAELTANGIPSISTFAAIERAATGESRQFRNGYTKELLGEDVIQQLRPGEL